MESKVVQESCYCQYSEIGIYSMQGMWKKKIEIQNGKVTRKIWKRFDKNEEEKKYYLGSLFYNEFKLSLGYWYIVRWIEFSKTIHWNEYSKSVGQICHEILDVPFNNKKKESKLNEKFRVGD